MARSAPVVAIADTGALYALIDRRDSWHQRVVDWWSSNRRKVYVPSSVLPELCYLLQTRISVDAENALVRSVRDGEFDIIDPDVADVARTHALMTTFRDLPLGYVDATVIAIAERLDATELLTTDRRHFTVAPTKRSWALVP